LDLLTVSLLLIDYTLTVYRFELEINEDRLYDEFSQYGDVKKCVISEDGSFRYGAVTYASKHEAKEAIKHLHEKVLIKKPLFVGLIPLHLNVNPKPRLRRTTYHQMPPIDSSVNPHPSQPLLQPQLQPRSYTEPAVTQQRQQQICARCLYRHQFGINSDHMTGEKLIKFKKLCRTRSLNLYDDNDKDFHTFDDF